MSFEKEVRTTKKICKWYVLVGMTLTGMLAMAMFLGAWVAEADVTTPTVTVTPKIEFSMDATGALSVEPGASGTDILAVSAKSNAAWTVTLSASSGLLKSAGTPADEVPSGFFTVATAGATTTYDGVFTPSTVVLGDARGSYPSCTFTYKVDLSSGPGWDVPAHTDYTCTHTYTASN